jgi:uncharacterized membrane protein
MGTIGLRMAAPPAAQLETRVPGTAGQALFRKCAAPVLILLPAYMQLTLFTENGMTDQVPFTPINQAGLSDNAAGGLAYITFIPAILFLILEPYNRSRFVRFHAWQSLLLSASVFVINIALSILGRIPFVTFIDLFLYPLIWLGFFILWIIVLIQAFNGKMFKIPVLGDIAEKQAGS